MLSEISWVQRTEVPSFLSYVEERSKYKYKHCHIYRMFQIVGTLKKARRGWKEEDNDR
jgi:hypothetical protein